MFPIRTLFLPQRLGLWNGRRSAYRETMPTRFQIVCTRIAIPIMQRGIWIIEAIFVAIKSTMTEEITSAIARISRTCLKTQKENLKEKAVQGTATRADITYNAAPR